MEEQVALKRQRTKERTIGESSEDKKAHSRWPAREIPVEIFSLISGYLRRSTVQNMRLVNKEFEQKVSESLFRSVVVPFKHEIFGVSEKVLVPNGVGDIVLQDVGMRVFRGYGGRIRKFAMSFEFHETQLYHPPVKSDQEAITSFWGIYRWPFQHYNRFRNLEGMETTADKTKTMTSALRYVNNANELGLSIDSGLGWLAGPDINDMYITRHQKLTVFGESRFMPEPVPRWRHPVLAIMDVKAKPGKGKSHLHVAFERMLHEAGYRGDSLESSIRMMLESEHDSTYAQNRIIGDGFTSRLGFEANPAALSAPASERPSVIAMDIRPGADYLRGGDDEAVNSGSGRVNEREGPSAIIPPHNRPPGGWSHYKPNNLTTAQKEVLLETEWAQRAFMQSYVIAVVDNHVTFQHVETLTLARLPARQIPMLRRRDFWDSLALLQKFSLGVVPDWRDVMKLPTSFVRDQFLEPSSAVLPVYYLLRDQISKRKNIRDFHFEWLCGGEYAPGIFMRNKNVLAAPLLPTAMDMLRRKSVEVLKLPYLERLSLKNCWISPHVMEEFSLSLRGASLRFLTLETVSLTAPVAPDAALLPVRVNAVVNGRDPPNPNVVAAFNATLQAQAATQQQMAADYQQFVDFQQSLVSPFHQNPQLAAYQPTTTASASTNSNQQPNPSPTNSHPPPQDQFGQPYIPYQSSASTPIVPWWFTTRAGSWAEYIDHMTPATTIAEFRSLRYNTVNTVPPRPRGALLRIDFISCGYVRLPLHFDQTAVDNPHRRELQPSDIVVNQMEALTPVMMHTDHDPCLAVLTGYMCASEKRTIEDLFGFVMDWRGIRDALKGEMTVDGVRFPGKGRFDGCVYRDLGDGVVPVWSQKSLKSLVPGG